MQHIAFIGCGRVATHIAQFFQHGMDGVKVLEVCDLVKSRADEMATRLGAKAVYDLQAVLDNPHVTAVLILTESGKHGIHARQALKAGKHVIVEKPIALIPSEVIENDRMAKKEGLMYAVIKQNRYNPSIVQLKKTYDAGRFGKLVLGSIRLIWCRQQEYYEDGWHGTWAMDGGVISQQAIHHIDILQWICGPIIDVVSAQGNILNRLEAEDTTVALVRFKNGGLGTIEATTAARPEDREASISIVGERGMAEIGGIALNNIISWQFLQEKPDDKTALDTYSQDVPTGYGLSHRLLLQEIFDRLNKGIIEPPITTNDALNSVRLVHALYKSNEEHAWVYIDDSVEAKRLGKKNITTL